MFCFSCKAYEDFRKDVSLFDTAAVAGVSHVMSAHDVWTVWDFVNSFCAKEKRYCNLANWQIKKM